MFAVQRFEDCSTAKEREDRRKGGRLQSEIYSKMRHMPQKVVSDALSALRTLRSLRFKAFEDYSPRRTRGEKQKIPVSCGSISPATAAGHFGCQGNAPRLPLAAVFYDRFIHQQN